MFDFDEVDNVLEREGLDYFLIHNNEEDLPDDEEGKALFNAAKEATDAFKRYVSKRASEERRD